MCTDSQRDETVRSKHYFDQVSLPRPNQKSGPLAGHVKKGRTFQTPLAATGLLQIGDWVRDDLPDLLWPVLTLSELGTREAVRFVRWQKAVLTDLAGHADASFLAECLDGRLTSLDRLVAQVPIAKAAIKERAAEWGILPDRVAMALASYPLRPAEWLIDLEMTPPGQSEIDLLAKAVLEVLKDEHREAVIKCLYIWSAVQAGTFSTDDETIELLKNYPNDDDTRSNADTVVRASWGAHHGWLLHKDPDHFAESIKWAKVFWGANSMTTGCLRKRNLDESLDAEVSRDAPSVAREVARLGPEDFRQRAMDLMSSYAEAVETTPSRLYDQEREEVHTGLVSRTAREVITALSAPDLWCSEHGAHVGRTLVEIRILVEWMSRQDQETIYRKYQDFGAGKAKLYSRIAKEMPADWFVSGVADAVETIERASHNDDVFDHRIVDISSTFADGKSLREMATECDLLDLYRHAYQMESGVAHSEWWSVEIHAMERCLNVLHRGHLIPSLSLSAGGNEEIARSWIIALYGLMRVSLDILGTPEEAVQDAFSWLTDADVPDRVSEQDSKGAEAN